MKEISLGSLDSPRLRQRIEGFFYVVRFILNLWLCFVSIAVFRVLLREYNPIVTTLIAGLFIFLVIKQKAAALICGILLGVSFLLIDRSDIDIEIPDLHIQVAPTPNPFPSRVVTVYGGSESWVTAYTNVPFTNRINVSEHEGRIRINTSGVGDFVDHRGLLRENGVKYRLDNAEHLLKAGISVDQWLLSEPSAPPFSLVGTTSTGIEPPSLERAFVVGHSILVHKGESLYFSYNRIVSGEFGETFKDDSGYFSFRLSPVQDLNTGR